jgi:hypothetical protein
MLKDYRTRFEKDTKIDLQHQSTKVSMHSIHTMAAHQRRMNTDQRKQQQQCLEA